MKETEPLDPHAWQLLENAVVAALKRGDIPPWRAAEIFGEPLSAEDLNAYFVHLKAHQPPVPLSEALSLSPDVAAQIQAAVLDAAWHDRISHSRAAEILGVYLQEIYERLAGRENRITRAEARERALAVLERAEAARLRAADEEAARDWPLAERKALLALPMEERRRVLATQAEKAAADYNAPEAVAEREIWQTGDIEEY